MTHKEAIEFINKLTECDMSGRSQLTQSEVRQGIDEIKELLQSEQWHKWEKEKPKEEKEYLCAMLDGNIKLVWYPKAGYEYNDFWDKCWRDEWGIEVVYWRELPRYKEVTNDII